MTIGEVLKLTVKPFTATVVYHTTTWRLEGPPNESYQVWIAVVPELTDTIDWNTWRVLSEGRFSTTGTAGGMILLERSLYEGYMVRVQASGENDEHSNAVDLGPLLPKEEEPPKPPEMKYQCPYCTKKFATTEDIKDHIDTEHIKETSPQDVAGEVAGVAEQIAYTEYARSAADYIGTDHKQVQAAIDVQNAQALAMAKKIAGMTPKEVYESYDLENVAANAAYFAQVTAAVAMEAAPFVDIGMATLSYLSVPAASAWYRMAGDYQYSKYRYGIDPMIQRYWFERRTPLLPESYRLALSAAKGIITDAKYKKAMAQSGLSAEWADMWVKQNYLYPDFGQITNMYWRKLLTETTYETLMRLTGYRKEDIANLKKLTEIIPPLTDLITMAVREAFGEHTYKEQMPALVEWGAKMGLSEYWVKNYWYSHWDRIPLTQMYANLWRGHWTDKDFDRMLRIKDVHPDDREAIHRVAFLPPSIREMGYGYDFGRYTREDIIRYRRWGGLTEEDATKAADALVDFRTSAEWEAIRREFLWRFAHERDTEAEYRTFLKWTGLQPLVVDLWVYRGLIQQERFRIPETAIEYRIVTSSEALWAFKNNLKNEEWLRATLENLGWAEERVELAVERALYQKAMAEDIPDIITPRTLTISQLKSLYNAQLISIEKLAERLQLELHYTLEDATMLAKTFVEPPVEPEPEPTPRKLTLSLLKQLYEAQVINQAQLIVELVDSLNYAIEDAYAIAYLWTPKIEPEVVVPEEKVIFKRPYTDAWSRRLYAQRLFVPLQVYYNYIALGYDSAQADKLTVSMLIDDIYPMLTAQYKKGLIDEEYFLTELFKIGMTFEEAVELLKRTVRDFQVDRLDDERKLTKSEILKGMKSRVLTIPQTAELLTDIGYEYWEAQYIISLELVKLAGDPESYWEMKKVTEAYKKALSRDSKTIPDEIFMLDKQMRKIKQEIAEMTEAGVTESKMAEKRVELGEVEARLRKVLVLKKLD